MLTFSPTLKAQLDAAPNQVAWANTLKTTIGNAPRIRCWRDPANNAASPATTGTEFMNFAVSGITIKGYKITSFGKASNVTINLGADLTTGTSVLRIEGGGQWVQGTVGRQGSAADFIFTDNPTASAGVATAISMAPPTGIPSGTGYAPPTLDADAPAYVIIDNWIGGTYAGEAGRIYFNNRIKNWVFEDTEYAANVGDVRVTQSTQIVTHGDHEFGAMLLSTDPRVGTINGKVLHQVLINFKPTEVNWPNYPRPQGATGGGQRWATQTLSNGASHTYSASNTFMSPFKVRVMTADSRLLGTLDMPRDNTAINGEHLSEVPTLTKPQRLSTHCASMLLWESHAPKLNSYCSKYLPGVDQQFLRPSMYKQRTHSNPIYPPLYWSNQKNGINHWHALPKWSLPANKALVDADHATRATNDPYLYAKVEYGIVTPAWASTSIYNIPANDVAGNFGYGLDVAMQWGYEPGAYAGHDQHSGPGGIRFDRAAISSPHVIHMTNPNYVHLRDKTPITEMVQHWNKGYLNHAVHFFNDVKTFSTFPNKEVLAGDWAHYIVYYNSSAIFTDINHSVAMYAVNSGSTSGNDNLPHSIGPTDKKGRLLWNGYSVDWYHNYSSPGAVALFYNSPAYAVSTKLRYMASIMCQCARSRPHKFGVEILIRDGAWLFLQNAWMWKLASDHPLGISRAEVEGRIEAELMAMYNNWYVPVFVNNSQDMWAKSIRNLGLVTGNSTGPDGWGVASFSLHYYMAHVLQIWKQFGLWRAMMDKSPACKAVLLALIKCLDKGSIDYYLDTDGCYSGSTYGIGPNLWVGGRHKDNDPREIATSWADWHARVYPKNGPLEDLVHTSTGAMRHPIDVGEYSRMQWPSIRRDYFADIPAERDVNACCEKVAGWMKVWADEIARLRDTGATQAYLGVVDFPAHPALGRISPPVVLGD